MQQCVIYARVSSKGQEREGFSIPAQLDLLREYAKSQDYSVATEYVEAVTAKKAGLRDQFNLMVEQIKRKDSPKIILVEKTDRLSRNLHDSVLLDQLISSHNIEIHFVKESEILCQNASSHTKLIHDIKVVLAKNFIDNLSEETRKGIKKRAEQGRVAGLAPYGYKNINKTIEPVPEEAEVVKAVYRAFASGSFSLRALSRHIRDTGYVYKRPGQLISKDILAKMLSNVTYIGLVNFKGEVFDGTHEAIIPMKLWDKCQEVISNKSKATRLDTHDFLFKGMLTCGECGSKLTGERKKGGRYIYYRCTRMKDGCSQGYVNQDVILSAYNHTLRQMELPPSFKKRLITAAKELTDAAVKTDADERRVIDSQITKHKQAVADAYKDRLDGLIDPEFFASVKRERQMKIKRLESKRAEVDQAAENFYQLAQMILEQLETLHRRWKSYNFAEQKELVNIIRTAK